MPGRLTRIINDKFTGSGVSARIKEYEEGFRTTLDGTAEDEESSQRDFTGIYYDLVTDFYEYGWGRSFHFAPRVPGESFKESLARHERNMADVLALKPGMTVADMGCGVGGPLLEMARYSGARIVGVNSNAYQLEHARQFAQEAGLEHLAEFLHCNFLHVDAPDESFDAIYEVEATCHAPDKESVYGEIYRLLKPGAYFAGYEYCMTERFDPQDPRHVKAKAGIELGGSIPNIDDRQTVVDALHKVGFEVLETRDLAVPAGPSIPWYQPLAGEGISLASFRSSRIGRALTHNTLKVLEALHIVPQGTVRVSQTLNLCASAMVEAGRLGIFTPMLFIHARKPD